MSQGLEVNYKVIVQPDRCCVTHNGTSKSVVQVLLWSFSGGEEVDPTERMWHGWSAVASI